MREPALAFLDDTKKRPGTREASIAHRLLGSTCWLQGDFVEARMHLKNSLAIYDNERDRDFGFRFGQDTGVSATSFLLRRFGVNRLPNLPPHWSAPLAVDILRVWN
jgi:hypothetical protein